MLKMSSSAVKQNVKLHIFVFSVVFYSLYCSDDGSINQFYVDIEMAYIRADLWAQVSLFSAMEKVGLWWFFIQEPVMIFVL